MKFEKKTDILHEVLTSDSQDPIAGIEELNSFLCQAPKTGRELVQRQDRDQARPRKKKTTLYLSPETFERLGLALPDLRALFPAEVGRKFSRSRLVDSSMLLLLREFADQGRDSLLIRQFMEGDGHGAHSA
jgi:hypothetical protein